jgi:hypothetical protein
MGLMDRTAATVALFRSTNNIVWKAELEKLDWKTRKWPSDISALDKSFFPVV